MNIVSILSSNKEIDLNESKNLVIPYPACPTSGNL
jgi:hypothetical protein